MEGFVKISPSFSTVLPGFFDMFVRCFADENGEKRSVFVEKNESDARVDSLKKNGYTCSVHTCYANPNYVNILASKKGDELFTFVIQGCARGHLTDVARNTCFAHGAVVEMLWNDDEIMSLNSHIRKEMIPNKQNIYFQCISTVRGLEKVKTKHAIKHRSDEYYTNMQPIIDKILSSPGKIISNNVFARRTWRYPYHVSDHIIGGMLSDILSTYVQAKTLLETDKALLGCAEQHIVCSFLKHKNIDYNMKKPQNEITNTMKENFDIVAIKQLGDYHITANSQRIKQLTSKSSEKDYKWFIDIECIDEL